MPNLYTKGITMIGDLLQYDVSIILRQNLMNRTGVPVINDLHYLRLKMSIKKLINKNKIHNRTGILYFYVLNSRNNRKLNIYQLKSRKKKYLLNLEFTAPKNQNL